MRAFAAGDIDVLVATTVIEVGVDVANATAMVLIDADRFGVSQLHQLRGRVGRGGLPGLCLLVSHAEAGIAGPRPAGRRGGHHRRLRAQPGRPRAAPRGRRSRANRSRDTARGCRICACCATRRRSCEAREAAVGLLDADPDLAHAPDLAVAVVPARAVRAVRLHGEVVRSHDAHHRRPAGGRRLATPRGAATRPDQRPGARGAVLRGRVVVRLAARPAVPRPVRRLGRGRARGLVARRRRRHAGRAGPPYRRADLRERPRDRLREGRRRRRLGRRARCASRRARRTTSSSSTRRTRSATRTLAADLAAAGRARLAGARARWSSSSGPRAAPSRPGRTGFTDARAKRYGETTLWYAESDPGEAVASTP